VAGHHGGKGVAAHCLHSSSSSSSSSSNVTAWACDSAEMHLPCYILNPPAACAILMLYEVHACLLHTLSACCVMLRHASLQDPNALLVCCFQSFKQWLQAVEALDMFS
jgi:hypothetical protein